MGSAAGFAAGDSHTAGMVDIAAAGDTDSQFPQPKNPCSLDLNCTVVEGAGSRNQAGDATVPGMTVAAAGELDTVDSGGNQPRTGD